MEKETGSLNLLINYMDRMTELFLSESWPESKEETDSKIVAIARARTLATLRELDGIRKGTLVRFLKEARLLKVIGLANADLRGADLEGMDLRQINLSRADLQFASLSRADFENCNLYFSKLEHANLNKANLKKANLEGASFWSANLKEANLSSAYLFWTSFYDADLSEADLSFTEVSSECLRGAKLRSSILFETNLARAKELKPEQIEGENHPWMCRTRLPKKLREMNIHENRDCDQMPTVLSNRYIGLSIEKAQQMVNELQSPIDYRDFD